MDNNKVKIGNPHLKDVVEDHFHHLGFDTANTNISKEYADIKVSFNAASIQATLFYHVLSFLVL